MYRIFLVAIIMLARPQILEAQPLSRHDREAVERLLQRFTQGWLQNDRKAVMGLFAPEAVFIPHDGVQPHRGWSAIDQFWFPKAGTAGTVTSFRMSVEGISGNSPSAIVWGKSDLRWQNTTTAFHWPGYYLMVARPNGKRWVVTHLMSSDEEPTSG